MFYRPVNSILNINSRIKSSIQKMAYSHLNKIDPDDELIFLNYGFMGLDGEFPNLYLEKADKKHRTRIHLYHRVTSYIDLHDKDVLEVGSGRGGGASYIVRYLKPKSMVGVDYVKKSIDFCNKFYLNDRLSFIQGDALSLNFEKESFDVVINVESSHHYICMNRFLEEVYRVLRPGGHLLLADFRRKNKLENFYKQINNSKLNIVDEHCITPNVLKALDNDHEQKIKITKEKGPFYARRALLSYFGIKGKSVYNGFQTGRLKYLLYVLQKK